MSILKKGFSIIICCYNSENKILETLEYINQLNTNDFLFEVLVVDNGSIDTTEQTAKEYLSKTNIKYHIIYEPKVGKANALLKGFEFAQYDKMVVCDDDVLLNSDYLIIAEEIFKKDSEIGIIGGRGVLKPSIQTPFWFDDFASAFAVGEQWDSSGDITYAKGYIWGAGSIINKNAWVDLKRNGFRNFYTGLKGSEKLMAGEDTELSIWVVDAGYKLYYTKDLIYTHNISSDRICWSNLVKLFIGFSRSQVYLDLLKEVLEKQRQSTKFDIDRYISNNIKTITISLLKGFFSFNYFKTFWIAFVQKREGYAPILSINDKFSKLKEYSFSKERLIELYQITSRDRFQVRN